MSGPTGSGPATALVYPSLAEGFGLPLVEALARGLPAFASDLPVFRETSDGFATFCDPNDPQMLTDQLMRFLREGRDPALRPLTEFRWPTWEKSVSELLERMLSEHPERAAP
jgi:alpha-1,2-rhamnosyltransferase